MRFYTLPWDMKDYPWLFVAYHYRSALNRSNFKHAIHDCGVIRFFKKKLWKDYPPFWLYEYCSVAEKLTEKFGDRLLIVAPDYPDDYHPGVLSDNVSRTFKNLKFCMNYEANWLPVIQSPYLDVDGFRKSCERMKSEFGDFDTYAIGTVCKTNDLKFIIRCCKLAREYFPNKLIHAFGLTLSALPYVRTSIDSFDSMAWAFPRKHGLPSCKNSQERREYFKVYLKRVNELLELDPPLDRWF